MPLLCLNRIWTGYRIEVSVTKLALALSFFVAVVFGQPPGPPVPGQKPLRERLLERALKGDAEAQFDLGKNYETGRIGLPKDFAQAEHWYREAAVQGDPYAEASLAILLQFGKGGIHVDQVQAYMWYQLAVDHSTGADQETIVEMRDSLGRRMAKNQVVEAQRLAHEWKPAVKQ
jgi:Sel1 repeat